MKSIRIAFFSGMALLPGFLGAQVKETPATLALVQGGNPQGFIQNSNDQGVFFASSSNGQAQLVPYSNIRGEGLDKLIRLEERNERLSAPRQLYADGHYAEAAEAFGQVARDYAILLGIPKNFASEALFYQIDSLKRAGQYPALAALVNSPAAATILSKLPEAYHRPFEFHKLWALYGQKDFAALKEALAAYEEPVLGSDKLLKAPNFKNLPANELAQLAFLRGKVYDSEGAKDKALDDFYRTLTLAFGNDALLAKLAMGAAMVIQKEDPQVAQENSPARKQMESLAYLFENRFGKDAMPEQFRAFSAKPAISRPLPTESSEAPAAEAADKDAGKEAPAKGQDKEAKPKE